MAGDLSPTMRRWDLGRALRQIRESQGKTIEQVSDDLLEKYQTGFSATKISRMETGKRGANPRDVRDLCDYYGVDQAEQSRLVELAKVVRGESRLQAVPDGYAEYLAIETHAQVLRNYEPMFVPGTFQTVEYHRAAIDAYSAAGFGPDSAHEESLGLIQIRVERQRRMTGPNALTVHSIIDENVVRRRVGSDATMAAQLDHLVELSLQPNITLRIVPAACGLYPGCESAGFSMLGFEESDSPNDTACYIEGLIGTLWAERAADLVFVSRIFENLKIIALGADDSRALIREAARAYA